MPGFRKLHIGFWGLFLGMGIVYSVKGQNFPTTGTNFPNNQSFQNLTLAPDSLGLDSLGQKIEINPDTRLIDLQKYFNQEESYTIKVKNDFSRQHRWDEIEDLQGFVQSLGQLGKPYLQWQDGLPSRFLYNENVWQDPIHKTYNHYVIKEGPFYDTKTPYVNVRYLQGPDRLQKTEVTASQNLKPWWNISFFIRRRLSKAPIEMP